MVKQSEQNKEVSLMGAIDAGSPSAMWGWALDTKNPHRKLILEIFLDGEKIAETIADKLRPDLLKPFNSDGKHGYDIRFKKDLKPSGSGLIVLKDKESGKTVSANTFSLKYDFNYLFGSNAKKILKKSSIQSLQDTLSLYDEAILEFENKNPHKAQNIIETMCLEKSEPLPEILYTHLLSIYLSSDNTSDALRLYRIAMDKGISVEVEGKIHSLILSYCSDLWLIQSPKHLPSLTIRKLEMLFVILENLKRGTHYFFEQSSNPDNLLLVMFRSGMLSDPESIEVICSFIVGEQRVMTNSKRGITFYRHNFDMFIKLRHALHHVDPDPLQAFSEWIEQLIHSEGTYVLTVVLLETYLDYLDALINTEKINVEEAVYLLQLLKESMTDILDGALHLLAVTADIYAISGEMQNAYNTIESQIEEHISYFNHHVKYLPEILFSLFRTHAYSLEKPFLLAHLKRQLNEGKSSYTDNIILLSDMYKNSAPSETKLLFKIVQNLVEGKKPLLDAATEIYLEKMLSSLMQGLEAPYIQNAESLKQYFKEDEKKAISLHFHTAKPFEIQNLYYLSVLNEQSAMVNPNLPEKRLRGLLDKERREHLFPEKENTLLHTEGSVTVLAVMNRRYETLYLKYYETLLLFTKKSRLEVYLCSGEQYYHLVWDKEKGVVKEQYAGYRHFVASLPTNSDCQYLLLPALTILHHQTFQLITNEQAEGLHYLSFKDNTADAFTVSMKQFQFFSGIGTVEKYNSLQNLLMGTLKELSAYSKLPSTAFRPQKKGILSFENIEKEKLDLLTDFNRALFELHDIPRSLAYMTLLYSHEKITHPLSIHTGDVSMVLLKPFNIKEEDEDIACILVQRNEYLRLEGYLEYYRSIGVNKFYIVDNASDDGKTIPYLLEQHDVELYSAAQAYSQSLYGVKWEEAIVQSKRVGKWTLIADADELLLFDSRFDTLQMLSRHLEKEGHDTLYTPFVDMYAKNTISQTPYSKGKKILETCAYYDRHFYTFFDPNGGITGDMNTYIGGVRSRVFGLNTVILNKVPFFKYSPQHKLREGIHWIDNASLAYGHAVLLHFKYIETFHTYVEEEIKRGQHWDGASEYQQYQEILEKRFDLSLYDPILSRQFTTVEDFYENLSSPFTVTNTKS